MYLTLFILKDDFLAAYTSVRNEGGSSYNILAGREISSFLVFGSPYSVFLSIILIFAYAATESY
jgi:hypothetical protein